MSPRRRISTSTAIALVGVAFVLLGVLRWVAETPRSPVIALGFGALFVVMGLMGVVDGRRRRREGRQEAPRIEP